MKSGIKKVAVFLATLLMVQTVFASFNVSVKAADEDLCNHDWIWTVEYKGEIYSDSDFYGQMDAETGEYEDGVFETLLCNESFTLVFTCSLCGEREEQGLRKGHVSPSVTYEYDGEVYTTDQFLGTLNEETNEREGGLEERISCELPYITHWYCDACGESNQEFVEASHRELIATYEYAGIVYSQDEFYGYYEGEVEHDGIYDELPCESTYTCIEHCYRCGDHQESDRTINHKDGYSFFEYDGEHYTSDEFYGDYNYETHKFENGVISTIPCLTAYTYVFGCDACNYYEETIIGQEDHRNLTQFVEYNGDIYDYEYFCGGWNSEIGEWEDGIEETLPCDTNFTVVNSCSACNYRDEELHVTSHKNMTMGYEYNGVQYTREDFEGEWNEENEKYEGGVLDTLSCGDTYKYFAFCDACGYEENDDIELYHDTVSYYTYDGNKYDPEVFFGHWNSVTQKNEGGIYETIQCGSAVRNETICLKCGEKIYEGKFIVHHEMYAEYIYNGEVHEDIPLDDPILCMTEIELVTKCRNCPDYETSEMYTREHRLDVNASNVYYYNGQQCAWSDIPCGGAYTVYYGICTMCGTSIEKNYVMQTHYDSVNEYYQVGDEKYSPVAWLGIQENEVLAPAYGMYHVLPNGTQYTYVFECTKHDIHIEETGIIDRESSDHPDGMCKEYGVWKLYVYGKVATSYNGIYEYIGGKYYLKAGIAQTDWQKVDGYWYYFDKDTALMVCSKWVGEYYLQSDGTMATNKWIGDYYVGADGKWVRNAVKPAKNGWVQENGYWYYYKNNTKLTSQWVDGGYYYVGADGKMATSQWIGNYYVGADGKWVPDAVKPSTAKNGWAQENGYWYYYKNNAKLTNQWVDGGNYYVGADGKMATSTWIGNYYVGADGKWVPDAVKPSTAKNGWAQENGYWYYYKNNTKLTNQWVDGGNYYVGADGKMATSTWIDNYYVGADGKWVPDKKKEETSAAKWLKDSTGWWYRHADGSYTKNGWEKIDGKWYHFNASGYMQTGWIQDGGTWYYLNASGAMVTGEVTIDGRVNLFSSSGAWLGYK